MIRKKIESAYPNVTLNKGFFITANMFYKYIGARNLLPNPNVNTKYFKIFNHHIFGSFVIVFQIFIYKCLIFDPIC